MAKIAMIGAGSLVFCKTLMADFLATPALAGSEYRLMALTHKRLDKMQGFVERMIKDNGVEATVTATTDRREALRGADYVVVMIQVGRRGRFQVGLRDPDEVRRRQVHRRHPGTGRHLPRAAPHPRAAGDRRRHAGALPQRACCSTTPTRWPCAAGRSGTVEGLQLRRPLPRRADDDGPHRQLHRRAARTRSISSPPASTTWPGSSAWNKDGRDLYPLLKANFEKPGYYVNEKVRGEVMRHFGYFMTESTGHLSEYLPYFRKNKKALELYCDEPGFGGETGAYYQYCAHDRRQVPEDWTRSPSSRRSSGTRSAEYCSHIIEAKETGHGLPAERQHPQRRLHHQPARRVLRGGADLRRPHWACTRPTSGRCPRTAPR